MYPYMEIFGRLIPSYLVMALIGLVFTLVLALIRRKKGNLTFQAEDVILMILIAAIGAMLGAKAFQLVGVILRDGNEPGFWTWEHWKSLIPTAGVFYGGFIGGFAAMLIYIRKNKFDFWKVADLMVPSILLFCTFGRIGCFLAGCCYGKVSHTCGIVPLYGAEPLIPVQLYESAFTLVLLIGLLITRPERKREGILLPIYILSYAAARFALEFFRGDMQRGVFILSTSQWISLLMVPLGIYLLLRNKKHNEKPPAESNE